MSDQRDVRSMLAQDAFPPMDQIPVNTGIPPSVSAKSPSTAKIDDFDLLAEEVKYSRRAERSDQLKKVLRIGLPVLGGLVAVGALIWWMTTFDATAWQIFFGVIGALIVAAGGVLWAILLDDEDNPVPLIAFSTLTVGNGLLMYFFPSGYGVFGGVASIGLAVALGALTLAMNDGVDPWGCVSAFGMAANILIATSLAGVTVLWIIAIVILLILCAVLFIPFADDDMSIAAGVSMLVLLAVVFGCGHLFAPHYAHMLHQTPTASVQENISVDQVTATCSCGDTIDVPGWLFSFLHNSHCETEEFVRVDEQFHYQICSCGSVVGYEEHEYEYFDGERTDRCVDCGGPEAGS